METALLTAGLLGGRALSTRCLFLNLEILFLKLNFEVSLKGTFGLSFERVGG